MHTGERVGNFHINSFFRYIIDSKMLFGQLSKYLHACLIAMWILFVLSVDTTEAVQGNEVAGDCRLGANEITGSVAVQRDSGIKFCTVHFSLLYWSVSSVCMTICVRSWTQNSFTEYTYLCKCLVDRMVYIFSWNGCNVWINQQWHLNIFDSHIILNPQERQMMKVTCLCSTCGISFQNACFHSLPLLQGCPGISWKDSVPIKHQNSAMW